MYRHITEIADYSVSLATPSQQLHEWISQTFLPSNLTDPTRTPDLSIEVHDGYGVPFQDFDVDIVSDDHVICYRRADYMIQVDLAHTHASISVYDSFALKHALMNLYSVFTVQRGSGLLIHSSCIVQGEGAYLFSGRSGAGKSTIALLSAPRRVLSNEATVVRIHDDGVKAYNSFPFRSDPGLFIHGHRPLQAIHFLQQSQSIHRTRISVAEAMVQLMDKIFFWAHDPTETAKLTKLVKRLVELVPSYNLYFQKNDEFWREIS